MRQVFILSLSFIACTISAIHATILNCNDPNEKDSVLIQRNIFWKKCKDGKEVFEACIIETEPDGPAEYLTADQMEKLYLTIKNKTFLDDEDELVKKGIEESITSFCVFLHHWSKKIHNDHYFSMVKQLVKATQQTTVASLPSNVCEIKIEGKSKIYAIVGRDWAECVDGELVNKKCLTNVDKTGAQCISRSRAKEILNIKADEADYADDYVDMVCMDFSERLRETKRAMNAKHLAPNCADDNGPDEVFSYLFEKSYEDYFDEDHYFKSSNKYPSQDIPEPFFGPFQKPLTIPENDVPFPWHPLSIPKRQHEIGPRYNLNSQEANFEDFSEEPDVDADGYAWELEEEEEESRIAPIQRKQPKIIIDPKFPHKNEYDGFPGHKHVDHENSFEIEPEEPEPEPEFSPKKTHKVHGRKHKKIIFKKPGKIRKQASKKVHTRKPLNPRPLPPFQIHDHEESNFGEFKSVEKSPEIPEPVEQASFEKSLEHEEEEFFKHLYDHDEVFKPFEGEFAEKEEVKEEEESDKEGKTKKEDDAFGSPIVGMPRKVKESQIPDIPKSKKDVTEDGEATKGMLNLPEIPDTLEAAAGPLPNEITTNPKFQHPKFIEKRSAIDHLGREKRVPKNHLGKP